eukprot:3652329-Prymnesium_polylepis.1
MAAWPCTPNSSAASHYDELLNASAFIGPDELMSPYLGAVAPTRALLLLSSRITSPTSHTCRGSRRTRLTGEEILDPVQRYTTRWCNA